MKSFPEDSDITVAKSYDRSSRPGFNQQMPPAPNQADRAGAEMNEEEQMEQDISRHMLGTEICVLLFINMAVPKKTPGAAF